MQIILEQYPELLKLYTKDKRGYIGNNNRRVFPKEFKLLKELTNFLQETTSLTQRLWHITNNILNIPLCKFCNHSSIWDIPSQNYSGYCSVKCANKDEKVLQKRKETMLKNHGVEHAMQSQIIYQKGIETNIKKYGVKNISQSSIVQGKIKETNLEKYGVENAMQSRDVQETHKSSMIKKYGVENAMQIPENYTKSIITKIEKYGSTNNIQKQQQTIKERYNRQHRSLIHISLETLAKLNDKEWLTDQHHINKLNLSQIATMLNVSLSLVSKRFQEHDIECIKHVSLPEQELRNLISTHYNIVTNDRSLIYHELDIYIPDLNLAIEYNGIIWHSDDFAKRNQYYHLNKTIACNNKNIRLIHILSSEWIYKHDIVLSYINELINISPILTIFDSIIELTHLQSLHFFTANHINYGIMADLAYGIIHNGNIVSAMSFTCSNNNEYLLTQYCNKLNLNVTNSAQLLLEHFIKSEKPNSIIVYMDKRWEDANFYGNLGFNYRDTISPDYYYFNKVSRKEELYSRLDFQYDKLPHILPNFDPTLSEWENMLANKYDRIWDCGQDVLVWNKIL